MRAAAVLLILALAPALRAEQSQVFSGASQVLPLFGRLGTARLAALGGAFQALAPEADALLANPAGLAEAQGLQASAQHESWLGGLALETLSLSLPLRRGMGGGVYAHVVDYGSLEVRDAEGRLQGDMAVRDYAAGAALGMRSVLGLSGGLGLRVVRESLIGDGALSMALDAGLLWQGEGPWRVGLAAIDVGPAVVEHQGAESLRLAVARKVVLGASWLWPAVGLRWEPQGALRAEAGLEFRVSGALDLRVGYEQHFSETYLNGLQGLTLGLGFQLGSLGVDYAYLPYGDLGAGHRISLQWHGQARRPVPGPAPAAAAPALTMTAQAPVLDRNPLAVGQGLEAEGRWGEALSAYEEATALDPGSVAAWRHLAELAFKLGDRTKTLAAFEHLLALAPDPALTAWLEQYRAAAPAP